jgi:hypothetical protein
MGRTYPVGEAAEAVVRGIERRSRTVVCPRWLPAMIVLRPLLPRLAELLLRREMAEFDRIAEREAATLRGEPVGAGGIAERAGRRA